MKTRKNRTGGVEILIAEDSATQRTQLEYLLREHGYAVVVATDGKEALAAARRRRPAMIITDILMPELDGYGLCKAVKSDDELKDIPVVLLTTLADPLDVIRGLECGADNFIRKPYEGDYLLSRIEYLLMNLELRKNQKMQVGVEINLEGRKYFITSERQQILDLLISTYEQAVRINDELKLREKDLVHSNQVLNGLYRIAEGLNQAVSEREVAESALERALELPGIQAGWILLREGDAGLRLAAARNLPPALEVPGAMQGNCTCFRRLLAGELNSVTNILECERLGKATADTRGLRFHAAVPLWLGEQSLGVMNLVGPEKGLFTDEELKVLYGVGNQVALALERAHLHENLERLVKERTAKLEAEIAERRRIEKEQARLVAIIESTTDFIGTSDPEGNILYVNQAGLRMLGYDAGQDATVLSIRESHPEWAAKLVLKEGIPHAIAHGTWSGETAFVRRDGRVIPISQVIIAHKGASGSVEFLSTVARDITAPKEAERRIQMQLEHLNLLDQITRSIGERLDLASIFNVVVGRLEDSLPIDFGCVCLHDPVANALRVTCVGVKGVALARELSLDKGASIDVNDNGLGRCIQGQLVYEPDLGQVQTPFSRHLTRGGLGSLVMAPLRSERSQVFGILVAARRTSNAFSSVECEFLRQLSEHVALAAHQAQLHGALQQAYDDLRQTQQSAMQQERLRALGQMASGIAHDINNALSPVSLFTESLLETEQNLSERGRDHLRIIQRAVEDVTQTVARIREFYRPEGQLVFVPVEVNRLVQQVVDLTHSRWSDMPQQRGIVIQVQTDLAPGLPAIMGVESEIREVLTNLIFNAVDAMPEGGTLTMRTRFADVAKESERASIVIEIIDEGIGMDEDTRQHCLEPFFTTKGERGTGLGLAMVFGVVQRHGAEMEIESAPGAGTTVRLVFPVSAAVSVEPGKTAEAPAVPSRLRLLLIDDDPILLKSLQDVLETDGHFIVSANGGEEGIALFRTSLKRGDCFDAVITDLGMPYVDGRKVAAAVKVDSPDTPVILLTGWGRRLVADDDIPTHVDCVLAKPPKLRELRETLARCCGSEPMH